MASDYNKIFHKVPVQIPNKSGFDMSYENIFSATCGTLTPVMCEFLLPNDTVTLGVKSQIQLTPMATDFYGRIQGKFYTFFVPARLLYGGWQDFMTHPTDGQIYPSGTVEGRKAKYLPTIRHRSLYSFANSLEATDDVLDSWKEQIQSDSSLDPYLRPASLADYLGIQYAPDPYEQPASFNIYNPLPFLAYHKIFDDWYRDSRIQAPVFRRPVLFEEQGDTMGIECMPYLTDYNSVPRVFEDSWVNTSLTINDASLSFEYEPGLLTLADGVNIFELRQKNFSKDYFTNATTQPQAGLASQLAFKVDTETGDGSFSIASLRAANSLQLWLERNNLAGYRYGDQIKAKFGVYPTDAILDRSIYLGSASMDVYTKSVYQTNNDSGSNDSQLRFGRKNPFDGVGSKFGSSEGFGDGSLIDSFTATEHGFLMTIFCLVPSQYYGSGSRRFFGWNQVADFPDPLLAGVGDQPIFDWEINAQYTYQSGEDSYLSMDSTEYFGYTQRFSDSKFVNDQVHGYLRPGITSDVQLNAFTLDRTFQESSGVKLGTSFLEIPKNYLSQVKAYSNSNFDCWVDAYFLFKKSSTLPAYSIPTLGDMKDTHTEIIENGGTRL